MNNHLKYDYMAGIYNGLKFALSPRISIRSGIKLEEEG